MRVLEFENISKIYTLGAVGTGTLSHDINRWFQTSILNREDPYLKIGETNVQDRKGDSNFVWALKDINFSVERGEVIGIIGRNGSGKSTLLKILSRITTPTTGVIRTKGKVASLLEVGTGFHPDLSGRDNVYVNGAILGMTKHEIDRKFDEIVDFAGITRYVDTPVKRYSSGMKVRLGFAVAAHLEPEILIVDEVLAVGDSLFQKKAIGKMKSVSSEEGRTVLFVSHNMNSVLQLCNRGIILDTGLLKYDGDVNEAVSRYLGTMNNQISFEGIDGEERELYLSKASIRSIDNSQSVFRTSDTLIIEMEVVVAKQFASLVGGLNLYSQYDYPLARADYNDVSQITTLEPGKYKFTFEIPPHTLAPGSYRVAFDVAERNRRRYTSPNSDLSFEIITSDNNFGYTFPDITPKKISIIHENWLKKTEKIY